MIRVIIVEDERVIRNGIKNHVLWNGLGVGEVRVAENADEACSVCEDYKPDIIISDIRMPGMNGIELCKMFRERFPDSQIIFISGFTDKEYLMAGISLGAISYVEKPISIVELSEAIKKAVDSVQRLKRQNNNILSSLLCITGTSENDINNPLFGSECGVLRLDTVFNIGIVETKEEVGNIYELHKKWNDKVQDAFHGKEIHLSSDYLGDNRIAVLISTNMTDEEFNQELKPYIWESILSVKEDHDDWFIGIGCEVSRLQYVYQSYQTAIDALKLLSYKGWNHIGYYKEERIEYQDSLTQDFMNRFSKLLMNKDKEVYQMLDEVYYMLIEQGTILNFHVRNIYYLLDNMVTTIEKRHYLQGLEQDNIKNAKFLDTAKTISEMHYYVYAHIKEVLEETEEEKNNFLTKHVIEYMINNLGNKDLCIQMMADAVYLTPTYLSNLFKKSTGITPGQYLADLRMRKAIELLKNPQLKLYQVAEMIGYEDPNYFAKIFKKKTGMLPSEYREIN